jgi:glycosyltransferase involved in cell wall biosynthesis
MVVFSSYPSDPRPRRVVEALLEEGMTVDLVCLKDDTKRNMQVDGRLRLFRIPVKHTRGGVLSYLYQYSAFIAISAWIFASRSILRRYSMIYVHNMPDVLVLSAIVPRLLGARVILDQHDPMPELMMTIFGLGENSRGVRILRRLERWSTACVHQVIEVNAACKRLVSSRSCSPEKISVVMNSPDGAIFPFRPADPAMGSDRRANGRFRIMYHGSLVERNGLDLAVDALARLHRFVCSAELMVYGHRTSYLDQVMEGVRRRGLSGSVHYLGPKTLEELVEAIAHSDVGVIPNHRNPFSDINTPTRIFEYLSLGTPVIAPRTAGIQEYFDEESLFFFEAGNAEELAAQLHACHADPDRAVQMTKRAQRVYLDHTWSAERETLVRLVARLLN